MSKKQIKKNTNVGRQITWEEVSACKESMMAASRKTGLNFSECEDVYQDLIVKAWKNSLYLDPSKGTVGGYLYSSARNNAIDKLRQGKRGPIYMDEDTLEGVSDAGGNCTTSDSLETQDNIDLVQRSVEELSQRYPSQRTLAFKMFSLEEKKGKEVARKLGVTEQYVYGSVNVTKDRLKDILKEMNRKDGGSYRFAS